MIAFVIGFIYGFVGFAWAKHAWRRQNETYGYNMWLSSFVAVVNCLLWPIGMAVARIRGTW